jgi:NADH-quinone oxidoreductase subunit M
MEGHILSLMTFLPALGALVLLFIPRGRTEAMKIVSAVSAGIVLLLAVQMFFQFNRGSEGIFAGSMQFVEKCDWIRFSVGGTDFRIQYFMGLDGLSVTMVMLIGFVSVFASWGVDRGVKGYFALLLLLETGMMGVFCALDFFLFYVFWEVVLLPMYFLIGIWGGPRKEYAAIKFFVYTLVGSVLMLLCMLVFYFDPHGGTFDLTELAARHQYFTGTLWMTVFIGLFIAFAIKVPVFPFHTWLPDAHVEAPTAVSVILAAVLLKMGVYGMLRICLPILPDAAIRFAPVLALLGVVNIVYGALTALAQTDLKKLVAYSSVSHMGFCLLGMAAGCAGAALGNPLAKQAAMAGTIVQMVSHGLITGMLFLLVGVIYDRAHHRDVNRFGGLAAHMPVYGGFTALAFMASLGIPGFSGFIGEVLVLLGAFRHFPTLTIIATSGIVITAGYFLWAFQRMFLGTRNQEYSTLPDLTPRELFTLIPLGLLALAVGVYPMLLLDLMQSSITGLLKILSFGG